MSWNWPLSVLFTAATLLQTPFPLLECMAVAPFTLLPGVNSYGSWSDYFKAKNVTLLSEILHWLHSECFSEEKSKIYSDLQGFFFFFLQINISVVVYSLSSLFQEHWSPVVLEHSEYISAPQPLLWLLCLKCSPDICFVHTCSSWIKYMFWVCVYVCEIFSKIRTLPSSGTIDHLLAFFSLPVTYHLTFSACWNVKLIPLRYIVCFVYCSCYTCNICDT